MFPRTPDTATPCSYFPATCNRKSQVNDNNCARNMCMPPTYVQRFLLSNDLPFL
ncbi:unnamed protein product [Ectocarpus sp. CCAP 1310/34]|nr:unnamed protein product [Ectocarpus sp. CCAP 1310/34]